ncbi:MAG: hypothetical protein JW904_04330 [Spirochaetales bacterium]|nr:hypothetical protein [Spirochaetales bacterium]
MKHAGLLLLLMSAVLFNLSAQEPQKVLQRVFVEQAATELLVNKDYFTSLPETLFSLITIKQPVIRVTVKDDAHTVLLMSVGKNGDNAAKMTFSIVNKEKTIDTAVLDFTVSPLPLEKIHTFLQQTASVFAGKLGPVPPLVRVTSLVQNEELRNTIAGIEFEEAMTKPFEITLSSYLLQKVPAENGGMMPQFAIPFPIYLDFTWFFTPNNGIDFSLYFEFAEFGVKVPDGNSVPADVFAILGGVGYTFQTLGRFQAAFGIGISAGVLLAIPQQNVEDSGAAIIYNTGDLVPQFMTMLRLKFIVSYNFTENFAVFLRIGAQLNMQKLILEMAFGLGSPDSLECEAFYGRFEAIGIGVLYRF